MNMPTCPSCVHAKGICEKTGVTIRYSTGCTYHTPKPQTNADRIRAMTDEELAHLLHSAEEHLFTGNLWSYEEWTAWLKREATDG